MAYTTNWVPVDARVGCPSITDVATTQALPFGTIIRAMDIGSNQNGEGEFMYVKGVASGATGSWVGVNADDYTTTLAAANGVYPLIGIMMSTLDAATKFGFIQISGKAVGKCLALFADNGNCYLTAAGTAGSVDDAIVAGDFITGAKGASAIDFPATGMAEFELARPFTRDGLDV